MKTAEEHMRNVNKYSRDKGLTSISDSILDVIKDAQLDAYNQALIDFESRLKILNPTLEYPLPINAIILISSSLK